MALRDQRTKYVGGIVPSSQGPTRGTIAGPINRRGVLKLIGAAAVGALTGVNDRRLHAADIATGSPLTPQDFEQYLVPFPGKRALLSGSQSDLGAVLQAASVRLPPVSSTANQIVQVTEWPVGSYPNYCDAAIVGQRHFIWVASFGAELVTRIDAKSGSTLKLPTGVGTLPLDVAYDRERNRVVVASADDEATMVVLDSKGNTLARKKLVQGTGQGLSDGGAQGVAVDAQGDYWFSLAYHGADLRGVVVKVDGDTLETSLRIKDVGLHNPNGILFVKSEPYILALSDNGVAHQFGLDGTLQRVLDTVSVGYRGAVSGDQLWVAAWSAGGQMARVDLKSGFRDILPCVPLANSVAVDNQRRVWVAGDAGISVSDQAGALLAVSPSPSYSNGLTSLSGSTYHTVRQARLNQVAIVSPRVRLPSILLSQ